MTSPLVVYTIVKRERDGRSAWVRIGSAIRNRDGSIAVELAALPTNGTMHIREQRPFSGPVDLDAEEKTA